MGRYITQAELESFYGEENVRAWADVGGTGDLTAIDTRIAEAIESAESLLEDRLRGGPYTIPFVADDGSLSTLKDVCKRLAGVELWGRRKLQRPEAAAAMADDERRAMATIDAVVAGQIRLGLQRSTVGPRGPMVVTPGRAAASQARTGFADLPAGVVGGPYFPHPNVGVDP